MINIFERIHPCAQGIFLFDNVPSHHKVAECGKQPAIWDTTWKGRKDGTPKDMKVILEERGANTDGMKVYEM